MTLKEEILYNSDLDESYKSDRRVFDFKNEDRYNERNYPEYSDNEPYKSAESGSSVGSKLVVPRTKKHISQKNKNDDDLMYHYEPSEEDDDDLSWEDRQKKEKSLLRQTKILDLKKMSKYREEEIEAKIKAEEQKEKEAEREKKREAEREEKTRIRKENKEKSLIKKQVLKDTTKYINKEYINKHYISRAKEKELEYIKRKEEQKNRIKDLVKKYEDRNKK